MKLLKTFLFLLLCAPCLLKAQAGAAFVTVEGEVTKKLKLYSADIAAMKHVTASLNDRDGKSHPYKGVGVMDILNRAGVTTGKDLKGENLAKYLLVKCADGYEVVFSLAELDSSFTERVVILADEMEGAPIPQGKGPFRLVVPGEKKPARSCQQVVSFVVRFSKEP